MESKNEFGKLGEQKAEEFLRAKGYNILERNYRYLMAEIDIIAKKDDILVIVEVKSSNIGLLKDISDVGDRRKVNLLIIATGNYVLENNVDCEVRFDVITLVKIGDKVMVKEHLENAYFYF